MLKRSIAFLLIFLFIIGPSFTVAEYGKQNESVENALEPEICSGDLDTPQMVSVRNSVGGVKIDWNAVPGAEKYRVYRKLGSGNWCKLLDTTSNNCLDKWAKSGNTYSYSVRCISAEGSFTSDMDPVGLSVFYLSAPKLKDATWNKKSVAISWEAVDGAENYRVYRKTGNGSWTACTDTTGTAFTDNTVVSGTKYAYTVKCISADGKKVISACDSKGKTITFTNMPSVKSVNNVIAGVKIAWNAVPGASLYRVFRKTGNGGWCKLLDTTELSTVDKWAKSGTVYTYTIRCVTADGSQYASAYDNVGKTIKRIATPKISTLKNDVGGVTMTWNAVAGAEKYRILRKTEGGSWGKLLDTTETSCKDKWAKSGTNYIYTVRCINADGSAFTSSYYEAGKNITYLSTPSVTVENTTQGVKVSWGTITGAAKYRVYRKTESGSWQKIGETTSKSYVDKTGTDGTQYYYTVNCDDSTGKFTCAFNSTGKSIKYKKLILDANVKELHIKRDDSSTHAVTITFTKAGTLTYSVVAKIENSHTNQASPVDCWWGQWNGDTIKLYIQSSGSGTSYITISNSVNDEKIVIKVIVEPEVTCELPETPFIITDYYGWITITKLDYEFRRVYGAGYVIEVFYEGTRSYSTSNSSSSFRMQYKLYEDGGYVAESGSTYTESISMGDNFRGSFIIRNLGEGDYRLELFH